MYSVQKYFKGFVAAIKVPSFNHSFPTAEKSKSEIKLFVKLVHMTKKFREPWVVNIKLRLFF